MNGMKGGDGELIPVGHEKTKAVLLLSVPSTRLFLSNVQSLW